jgi:hypothetical protein
MAYSTHVAAARDGAEFRSGFLLLLLLLLLLRILFYRAHYCKATNALADSK